MEYAQVQSGEVEERIRRGRSSSIITTLILLQMFVIASRLRHVPSSNGNESSAWATFLFSLDDATHCFLSDECFDMQDWCPPFRRQRPPLSMYRPCVDADAVLPTIRSAAKLVVQGMHCPRHLRGRGAGRLR